MSSPEFVHLHLHTDFSLLDGACEIKRLVRQAAEQEMPAVAVTDHGNLFAGEHFYREATSHGINPIIGCEVYTTQGSRMDREGNGERPNHLILLAENDEGYRNLCGLVTSGYLEGFYYKPRIDHELLSRHSRGLIALSACLRGEVAEALTGEKYDRARASAGRLREIFGPDNFFLEMQDQGLEIQKPLNQQLLRLSKETEIPVVATNDCHYLTRADSRAQDVLVCIQTNKTITDPNRMHFSTDQFYFKTAQEMARVFRETPEALARTVAIAERCRVKIEPVANPFPEFQVPEGDTVDSYFEKVAREGFEARRPRLESLAREGRLRNPIEAYRARLDAEIETIQNMRFAGYFLIVWDFIRHARGEDIPVGPGRGSAAGSLVSYALGITNVDPLEYGLLFERFLNPERISMPDIDIDFCMRRRGEVIEYVRRKYGEENVAQIITFGTLGARQVLRDAARALEFPYGEADRLAKLVPNELNVTLEDALKTAPLLKAQVEREPRVKELMEVAGRLEGLARHASTHAAGVVISPEPLRRILPLYRMGEDQVTTQYDMKALERLGLLKMDFLGLATLTVVFDTLDLIERNRASRLVLDELSLDDEAVYQMFSRGETTGIFQFESHGMRDILRRYQPTRLEDLTALNALYRPGPIQGGMIDDFIDRKHGRKRVSYELPELHDILEETWGVILYQEQVMQIANRLAGFSLGEADLLRRAMGKKKRDEMAAQREKFLAGSRARNVPAKKAEKIFDLMAEFAGYGFNKSHSCAYALLAYQTAYLKVHFPVEFMAALLTSEIGKTDALVRYIHEARGMGIRVLPPDVQESGLYFTPVGEAIRFGLAAVKNVGEGTAQGVLAAREGKKRFRNVFDFCESIEPRLVNRRVLESLIKSGAMDCFGAGRSRLLAAIDTALAWGQRMNHQRLTGQHGLFAGPLADEAPEPELPAVEEWSEEDQLAAEHATLGLYISGHPLAKYEARLRDMRVVELGTIENCENGEEVLVAGVVVHARPMRSRKGDRWAIMTLHDRTGMVELLAFPEAFGRLENAFKSGFPLVVRGRVNVEEVGTRVVVMDARPIQETAAAKPASLRLRMRLESIDEGVLARLDKLFGERPGSCPVIFDLIDGNGAVATLEAERSVRADQALMAEIREICGEETVQTTG
ncbi:MAG TPA: DNA polymerase III subunit alpha [Candidatus Dormibacteraeota bacterium]|nr:DNA polymerase III subunit alpha [Candidatus Dormibacteraeota bacterium]